MAFHEGDIPIPQAVNKMPMYNHAKTERMIEGPAAYEYADRLLKWDTVDLPHDYIISQRPDPTCNNTLGYFNYRNAWYRKRFRLEEADRGRPSSSFEVATHATVYVNGADGPQFCGYTPLKQTYRRARFGVDNVVAVYVDASNQRAGGTRGQASTVT